MIYLKYIHRNRIGFYRTAKSKFVIHQLVLYTSYDSSTIDLLSETCFFLLWIYSEFTILFSPLIFCYGNL